MTDDIVYLLRTLFQTAEERNEPGLPVEMLEAADEVERLREELAQMNACADVWTDTTNLYASNAEWWRARAERAEADADRLAAEVMRLRCACAWRASGVIGYRCTKCVVLDLHEREVESR